MLPAVPLTKERIRQHAGNAIAIIGAAIAATLIRMALAPLVGPAVPFATYFLAAILIAWYRGLWPAACFVPIAALAGTRYVLTADTTGILGTVRSVNAAILGFAFLSLTVSFLIDFLRRTSDRAKAAEHAQTIIALENARLLKEAESAAKKLQQANEQLLRTNRDLELFAYSASHDLQEPLRTISLFAQLLGSSPTKDGDIKPVGQILAAAQRMDALMQDIRSYLNTTRPPTEQPPTVDAALVLSEAMKQLQGSITATSTVITTGDLPMVAIHPDRLIQVLQNLISNAIKYRRDEPPRIHIEACSGDRDWVFSVTDNGIGIDVKFSEKIFELFKRLHNQEQYQGSGIGLALCQRILEQYGGRIWLARSELGKGSTFSFSLPRAKA